MRRQLLSSRQILSFGVGAVLLLLLTLHLGGIWDYQIFGDVDITFSYIAIVLLTAAWFIHALEHRLRVNSRYRLALLLLLLFAILVGVEALRSPQPVRGLTLYLITLSDLAIFLFVGMTFKRKEDMQFLNKGIFILGVGITLISLPLYIWALRDYHAILADSSRWNGWGRGIIYQLGALNILRFEGFVEDPNFFAWFLSLSFLCGITTRLRRTIVKRSGLFILGIAILLTFSRTALAALALTTVGILIIGIIGRRKTYRRYATLILLPLTLIGVLAFVIPMPSIGKLPARLLISRFEMGETLRLSYWQKVASLIGENPAIGHGLRMGEEMLGGQYTHNSYIDLLLELGIVGLIIYFLFAFLVLERAAVVSLRVADFIPWFSFWLITLIMFQEFSLLYHPLSWVAAGVILGQTRCWAQVKGHQEYV